MTQLSKEDLISQDKDAQKICINNHDGIFLVVAGPGVGKTYTIVKRIQKMIEQKINPNRILCLTFSDTAAREMKSRIGENNNVNVFTYHSFCLDIMEEFSNHFDTTGYKIITDSHKRALINECIDILNPIAYNNEKNNPYQYTDDILEGIEEIKKNRIKDEKIFDYNLHNNKAWKPHLDDLLKEAEEQKIKKNNVTGTLKNEINSLTDKIAKMEELWKFYELYNKKMKKLGYIDFNDMINMVLDKFESTTSSLLELVCEKYDYVIVDEYQDTNTAQNDIVFNLSKHINNIFVVGDDDQIIYTFQGAHLDTVEKFLNNPEFQGDKKVQVLCFDKNYRSTQNILDIACPLAELQDKGFYKFMASRSRITKKEKEFYETTPPPKLRFISKCSIKNENGNLLTKKLTASNDNIIPLNKPVEFIEFSEKDNERDYIVQKIISLKEEFDKYNKENKNKKNFKEKKLSQIAILTRKNEELKDFATYLKANGVPTEITGGKNIFEINSVNVLITYLQFLTNPEKYSDKLLSFMLLKPFHIDPRDYKTLIDNATHYKSLIENIKAVLYNGISDEAIKNKLKEIINSNDKTSIQSIKDLINHKEITIYNKEKLSNFVETFNYLTDYIASESYKNALIEISAKTGILNHYFQDNINKLENIKGFKKLLDESDSYFEIHKNQGNSFKDFVDYLTNLVDSGTKICLDKEDKPTNAVQLSTYHSSKGREFEYVFMPALTKGKWESSPSSYKELIPTSVNENETYEDIVEKQDQTKYLDNIKLLYVGITRAKHSLTLSYTKTDDATYGKLSWFIQQLLDNEKLNNIINKKYNVQLSDNYIIPKYDYDYNQEFKDYIATKLPNKFSVSGLNCYRNCPKQYFYNYILELKAESGSMDNTSFGTAMHSAFEYAIKEVTNKKKYPNAEEAYKVFCKKLDTLVCDYPDKLKTAALKGIFSDDGYYSKFISIVKEDEINNYEIKAEYQLSFETDINGHKIILNGYIDRLDKDKNGNYSIYDYKSKNHCSSISPSDNYFYQMAFYKYVFELQHPGCKIANAIFLFPLDADNKHEINLIDKFNKPVKDTDKTLYETKIEELLNCIKDIYNFKFDVPKKPNCEYCPYKQFCTTRTV